MLEEILNCHCCSFQQTAGRGEVTGKLSLRKQRFMQFSSLEHGGECYMTPRDFLFSVMFEHLERELFLVLQDSKKQILGLKNLFFRTGNRLPLF